RLVKADQDRERRARHGALDRFRAVARDLDGQDRDAIWSLIRLIGRQGYPTWEEIVAARSKSEILALAHRGEMHAETEARRDRGAQSSERRTCAQGVDDYLRWQEAEEFGVETTATAASLLRRALIVEDVDGVRYADRRVASLTRTDCNRILDELRTSARTG